ncbi:hypothetical protein ARALYDRAFT_899782 [Arabidopsis lyrata subsp. lyrata]|uniref:Aminotransferase-like plant mobile domain-containing protein n=1 Tax=Arabidopsis lyrata subsp. lyrata TaxID=81972 RepID=D7L4E7_ARALL|nr:hypothetical protein ARALYDRAFT_899782 [Arabidopsis lyrata subsp. lyrata]
MEDQRKPITNNMHLAKKFPMWKVDPQVETLVEATCFKHFSVTGVESVSALVIAQELNILETEVDALYFKRKDAHKNVRLDLNMLRTRFEKVPEGCRDCDAYLKAYLLYLLGTVIMPNNTEGVSPIYLPFLGKTTVNKYAWGAAMVGFLKDSLIDTKALLDQRKTGSISGFVYAIMVFALERFACVRAELSLTPPAKKIPLMLAWMDVLSKAPVKGTRIETFRDLLQNMKRDEVVWQPYHDFGELSDEFKDQLSMIYLRVPCICFNAVAYNRPDKCFRQLGLKKSELQRLSRSRSKHTKVKFSQHKGQDWRAVRPFYRKVNEE